MAPHLKVHGEFGSRYTSPGHARWLGILGLATLLALLLGVAHPVAATAPPPLPPLVIAWPTPAPITYGTPLTGLQLDAAPTAGGIPVPGFNTYDPPGGTVLHAGANQQLVATFTPTVSEFTSQRASVFITVNPAPTTLSLTVSPLNPAPSQAVTLTAVVSTTVTGIGFPPGTVTFSNGSSTLGPPVRLVNGEATFTTTGLATGVNNFNAVYTPDPNPLGNVDFTTSQASVGLGVGQSPASVLLYSADSTANVGQSVTLSARVSGAASPAPTPTGTISFFDTSGASPILLGTVALDSLGAATLPATILAVGSHRVLAIYSGDSRYLGSQSAVLTQLVRSCTVTLHLPGHGGPLLDLLAGAQVVAGRFSLATPSLGKGRLLVGNPTVTYCANPGRPNSRAMVSGVVTAGVGRARKGDQVLLTLEVPGGSRAPRVVLVDPAARLRLAWIGPFITGATLSISTP